MTTLSLDELKSANEVTDAMSAVYKDEVSHLIQGHCPPGQDCPFAKECLTYANTVCNHKGIHQLTPFACGTAQAFDLLVYNVVSDICNNALYGDEFEPARNCIKLHTKQQDPAARAPAK